VAENAFIVEAPTDAFAGAIASAARTLTVALADCLAESTRCTITVAATAGATNCPVDESMDPPPETTTNSYGGVPPLAENIVVEFTMRSMAVGVITSGALGGGGAPDPPPPPQPFSARKIKLVYIHVFVILRSPAFVERSVTERCGRKK
jgi:hypothetical protein